MDNKEDSEEVPGAADSTFRLDTIDNEEAEGDQTAPTLPKIGGSLPAFTREEMSHTLRLWNDMKKSNSEEAFSDEELKCIEDFLLKVFVPLRDYVNRRQRLCRLFMQWMEMLRVCLSLGIVALSGVMQTWINGANDGPDDDLEADQMNLKISSVIITTVGCINTAISASMTIFNPREKFKLSLEARSRLESLWAAFVWSGFHVDHDGIPGENSAKHASLWIESDGTHRTPWAAFQNFACACAEAGTNMRAGVKTLDSRQDIV